MKILPKNSLRKKLMLVLLLTSLSTLLFSTLGFAVNDWYSLRSAMLERLHVQAVIVGNNSVAALSFGDIEAAEETLASLQEQTDIVGAALYGSTGQLFATYLRGQVVIPATVPDRASGYYNGNQYAITPIHLDGEYLGNVMVISNLSYWEKRRLAHLNIAITVFFISLLLALLISSRLQKIVSKPILKLAATARQVSETQNYQLRAEKLSNDEIGTLVEDFNSMLQQVQMRENELQNIKNQLEDKVRLRTLELTELTRQLKHQAYHDTLTGLANRVTFDDHLRLAIDQARRNKYQLAVMFLDLDRFKVINDTLGHGIGDKLLIEISQRLNDCLRASDTLARLGGDEFAVLLPQTETDRGAAEVANKLTEVIARPIQVEGYSLHVTTSIGISLFPDDGEHAESIIKNADTAMYRSKDNGRNQATFFSVDMNTRLERRLVLETRLRKAIEQNQLHIHYQPRHDIDSMNVVGYEALVRWNDPEIGPVSPDEFIPLAEECGLISAIDEWVLDTACIEMKEFLRYAEPGVRLAVNLSPAQFIREDLHEVIANILLRRNFPGNRLELEITETLFGPGSDDARSILEHLCNLGVEISIDDFGTAYSSLSRLKQLPLHTLKIDKSFVRDLGKDADDEALVITIITMAHNLNLSVVAEGVESMEQYEFVKLHGCDTVQGYLFGKPAPISRIKQQA